MGLAQQLLGQDLNEVTLESITAYFHDPRTESEVIEFKSYAVHGQNNHNEKQKAILKSICGMLNTEGGVIVWGAPVEQTDPETNLHYCQGILSPISQVIVHDHLMSRIIQSIHPLPKGIRLKVLPGEAGTCVCILEVEKSSYPIHRFDDRYWIRLDGQTVVAPHHFVEAIIKQVRYPTIEAYITLVSYSLEPWTLHGLGFTHGVNYHWIGIRHVIFNWSGLINEEDVTFTVVSEKGRFVGYGHPGATNYRHNGRMYRPNNVHPILYYGEPLTETYFLLVDPDELEGSTTFDVFIMVGGKKSPLKRSEYKIHLHQISPENPENGLEVIVENRLVADMHVEMDLSKEQMLQQMLNR